MKRDITLGLRFTCSTRLIATALLTVIALTSCRNPPQSAPVKPQIIIPSADERNEFDLSEQVIRQAVHRCTEGLVVFGMAFEKFGPDGVEDISTHPSVSLNCEEATTTIKAVSFDFVKDAKAREALSAARDLCAASTNVFGSNFGRKARPSTSILSRSTYHKAGTVIDSTQKCIHDIRQDGEWARLS
jgi:hypothetical protein